MELRRGACYVIEDASPEIAYRLFSQVLPKVGAGFCISRLHPTKVRRRLGSTEARLGWLAEAPGTDHFSANAMASLVKAIQQFVQEHQSSGLILVDGLEYVILHNGFQPTLLAFVEHLNEFIMGTQAIVLIALRPQTLDPRELALLERNLQVLRGPEVKLQLEIEELGDLLVRGTDASDVAASEPSEPKALNLGPDMGGPRVRTVRCARCGTENAEDIAFCVYCGSSLTGPAPTPTPAAESAPAPRTSAVKPIPRSVRESYERGPDFVGLIGVAFFLLIVGIVFTLNTNLVRDLTDWYDLMRAEGMPAGLFVRPPSGIVTSGMFFFGLLGLSNFLTAGLRWTLDRSRFGGLARAFAGIGFFGLAVLIWRYSLGALTGTQVLSLWTATLGVLLVAYIATGLYWVRARRPAPAGTQSPTYRP
jgi:Protein of unknown function (DUF835)